ncbi:hypothetical protein V8E52_005580 [Russula decolorans]
MPIALFADNPLAKLLTSLKTTQLNFVLILVCVTQRSLPIVEFNFHSILEFSAHHVRLCVTLRMPPRSAAQLGPHRTCSNQVLWIVIIKVLLSVLTGTDPPCCMRHHRFICHNLFGVRWPPGKLVLSTYYCSRASAEPESMTWYSHLTMNWISMHHHRKKSFVPCCLGPDVRGRHMRHPVMSPSAREDIYADDGFACGATQSSGGLFSTGPRRGRFAASWCGGHVV